MRALIGAVAQLGERRVRNAKVGSSILLRSTNIPLESGAYGRLFLLPHHVPNNGETGADTKNPGTMAGATRIREQGRAALDAVRAA